MKAEEIRALSNGYCEYGGIGIDALVLVDSFRAQTDIHREIAAQLAEMNASGSPLWLEFSWMGREVWIDVRKGLRGVLQRYGEGVHSPARRELG